MQWYWTWGGEFFGYRIENQLFAYHGKQVGIFYGDEIYGADGKYLGELMSEDRLITNCAKNSWRQAGFTPFQAASCARYMNYVGYVMYVGHEDFPSPDQF